MTDVPSNLVPTRISQLTEYDGLSQDGYLPYVLNGVTYKVRFGNIASVGAVPSTRTITGGSGLAGGGDLSADRVIYLADGGVTFSKLADSGVVAGVYGSATEIPVLTVDQKGRVTIATTTPINLTNYVQTSRAILAGAGLTGGGTLAADRTISIDFSNATPQPLGIPTAGTGTQAAREDHVHPAVDLSDTTETTGALPLSRGGTGSSLSPVAGAVLYSDGSNIDLSNPGTTGQFLISQGSGAPDWVDLTGGTTGFTFTIVGGDCVLGGTLGVANGGTGAVTAAGARVNLLPSYTGNANKVLAVNALETDVEWVTGGGGGGGSGTVTSVAMTVPTGLQVSGSPITTSGTLAVTLQSGYSIPTTASQANWDTAYSERLQWDGGSTNLVAATGRTSLGATTVGGSFFTLTNPSAVTFPRINADNSVSALTATNFRTAIGAGTGDGTVTSVGGTGSVNGITLTGTVTSSGSLTLGGTLSNVSLTTQVTGTLPVGNGGTGVATTPTSGQLLIGNGTGYSLSTLTAGSGVTITNGAGTITISATGGGSGTVTSVDASGGTTGLTFTGGPITTSGTLTLGGTLDVDNGGTGQTTYTDGQLLIGNSTGNTLTKATLTAGSGISITNGSGSITIAATGGGGSGTVTSVDVSGGTTGLTFSGGPVTSSGTITMAGTLDADNGGTGISSYTTGDILYASGATTLAKLADVATGNALISGGVSTAPSWGKIGLTTHVSGTLPIGNGGTGVTGTPTNGQLLIGNGTGFSLAALTAGSNITITNSSGGITIASTGGGSSLLGQTDSASPFETSLGYQAGDVSTGVNNTFIGYQAGLVTTTGTDNTAVGFAALDANTIGVRNAAVGSNSLGANTTGTDNTAVGNNALLVNTTGVNNTAVGSAALDANTTGAQNTAVGSNALGANTTGNDNVAFGFNALLVNTTGSNNTAVGTRALDANTTGIRNTAVGKDVLGGNVTGDDNTAVGYWSLLNNLRGARNTSVGAFALQTNSTANDSSAFGYQALNVSNAAFNVAFGNYAGAANTSGTYNTFIGMSAGSAASTAGLNTIIGGAAGSAITTGSNNTVIGVSSGATGTNDLTTGANNILIGYQAAASSATVNNEITLGNASITSLRIPGLQAGKTTGDVLTFDGSKIVLQTPSGGSLLGQTDSATPFETSLGYQAGNVNTGVNSTFVGYQAGLSNTTGADNTAVGFKALDANTTGANNTALGSNALGANTTGQRNIALGSNALAVSTTASRNIAIGWNALDANTTGAYNTVIGANAGSNQTTTSENTLIGDSAGFYITTGQNNTLIGSGTGNDFLFGQNLTTGTNNIIIGRYATTTNGSASNRIIIGNPDNTELYLPGLQAGKTTGDVLTFDGSKIVLQTPGGGGGLTGITQSAYPYVTALGQGAGVSITADGNTAVGYLALGSATSVSANSAFGDSALISLTSGYVNSAFGQYALSSATNPNGNAAFSYSALSSVTTGQYNTGIGYACGASLTTGSNNTVIGNGADVSSATVSNEITLGNSSIATLRCQVTSITSLSDARDKSDVTPLTAGIDFVDALNPVAFTWNMRDGGKVGDADTGFIAQELKAAQEQTGINIPGLVYESNPERLEAAYGKLIPVLVKAIQELSAKVAELEAKVN